MSANLVHHTHRPTVQLMRNGYGQSEWQAPVAVDAKAAREAYETAKRASALRAA